MILCPLLLREAAEQGLISLNTLFLLRLAQVSPSLLEQGERLALAPEMEVMADQLHLAHWRYLAERAGNTLPAVHQR
jgi:hypothetical protein